MQYLAIDSAHCASADLATSCAPYERLGLTLLALPGVRRLVVGPAGHAFSLDFLAPLADDHPLALPHRAALGAGRSLFAVALRVDDLDGVLADLARRDLRPAIRWVEEGAPRAWLPTADRAATDLVLVQRPTMTEVPEHTFPLRRLDHLAAVARPLDACCAFWTDVLSVPLAGEVITPTLLIRQFRIGQAVLELLGPSSHDSPLHHRPHGLVSLASWEVPDLEEACRLARQAGLTALDPVPGPLPGTRISTIPAAELGGVNMQLLQYR